MKNPDSDPNTTVKRMLGPGQPELFCDQCFELLDKYVDLEFTEGRADELVPGMRAHLEGCPACHEEYESLLALVRGDSGE